MTMDLEMMTCAVCSIARRAGLYIKKERESFQYDRVELKHAHDYVSYVDKGSEKIIVNALEKLLPGAGFVTEEGSASYANEQFYWVVDPLDGTTNFIHANAPYCVSIALCKEKEVLLGVVYEICMDECYCAWKCGGAFLNDTPIHVSNTSFEEALVGIELPYDTEAYRKIGLRLIDNFYGRVGAIRMNGSAAMSLCYVAAGRMDGWIERHIGLWDYMAGALIVQEAGGCVTNYKGEQYMGGNEIVATNGVFHEIFIAETRNLS